MKFLCNAHKFEGLRAARGSDPGRREPDALFRNALRHRVSFCGIIY